MATEVEARLLTIDVPRLQAALHEAGAVETEDGFFREVLYHCVSGDPHEYVRVRHDGTRVILTYKRRGFDTELRQAQEIEVGADDFDAAVALFDGVGLKRMEYREKHRTSYRLGEAVISIDRYPGIPAYAEVESSTVEGVRAACAHLHLDDATHFPGGVRDVYAHYGKPLTPGVPVAFTEEQRRAILAQIGRR